MSDRATTDDVRGRSLHADDTRRCLGRCSNVLQNTPCSSDVQANMHHPTYVALVMPNRTYLDDLRLVPTRSGGMCVSVTLLSNLLRDHKGLVLLKVDIKFSLIYRTEAKPKKRVLLKVIWEESVAPHWLQLDAPNSPPSTPSHSTITTPSNTPIP